MKMVLFKILAEAIIRQGGRCHKTGTIVVVEGPRFSTKAESKLFQSFGASVIGMTTVPEVTGYLVLWILLM
jgi:5'-methylthioadenosine phosphorylase